MRVATWNINGLKARLDFLAALAPRAPARRGGPPGAEARRRAVPARGARGARLPRALPRAEELERRGDPVARAGGAGAARAPRPGGARRAPALRADRRARLHERLRAERQARRPRRLSAQARLARRARRAPARRSATAAPLHVVGGDFNVCPAPSRLLERGGPERPALPHRRGARALRAPARAGLVDVFRARHPERGRSPGGTTGPATSTAATASASTSCSPAIRSPRASARSRSTAIGARRRRASLPSDHAPVWAEIGDGPAAQQRPS